MAKMKVADFIKMLKTADTCSTRYASGGIGQRLTAANRARLVSQYAANAKRNLPTDVNCYAFDCIGLGKAIFWGWTPTTSIKYGSNGVPDVTETSFFNNYCSNQTYDFSKVEDGWAVWMKGHIGFVIDAKNHLVVECSPKWANGVQTTAIANLGGKAGYNSRTWTKCGKINFIDYTAKSSTTDTSSKPASASTVTVTPATSYKEKYNTTYMAKQNFNLKASASNSSATVISVPKGTKMTCYGYYTPVGSVVWYYVSCNGKVGYACGQYLTNVTTTSNSNAATVNTAVKSLQVAINKDKGYKYLTEDGIYGSNTEKAISNIYVRYGSRGEVVKWVQGFVGTAQDGAAGNNTVNAIKKFQKDNGLSQDGVAGPKTVKAILKKYGVNC